MTRTLLDEDLREWEVFASTGRFGFPAPARVVFRCVTDPGERARALAIDGDKSDAEALVVARSDEELKQMMTRARSLD